MKKIGESMVVIVVHPNGEATAKLPQKMSIKCENRRKAIKLAEYKQLKYRLEWELPAA